MLINLPTMQVRSLNQGDPLERCMASQSSILAWRIPWTEEPGGLWSMGLQRVRHDWSNIALNTSLFLYLLKDELRMFFLPETLTDYPPLPTPITPSSVSSGMLWTSFSWHCVYQQISTKLSDSCLKDYELLEGNSCLFIFLSLATSIMCDT